MKKIFTLVSLAFFTVALKAQVSSLSTNPGSVTVPAKVDVTPVTPSEDLLVLKEKEYNFGKIPQGKPVTHIFEVNNKSTDTLRIVNIQASCGCTTPEWERDKAVAPGGNTKITVGYNAAAEGSFTKMITVTYNGTQTRLITISGEVWKTPATSAPENKNLNDLKN